LARYAKHNGNFVLVVSGSLEAERTKKFIEIVYDFLIKAIELGSFALLKFGVRAAGLEEEQGQVEYLAESRIFHYIFNMCCVISFLCVSRGSKLRVRVFTIASPESWKAASS